MILKYFLRFVSVILLITVIQAQRTYIISISSGIADVPMKAWNDWQKRISDTEYTKDRFALVFGGELEYFYKSNQSINFEVSRLTYSSMLKAIDPGSSNMGETFSFTNYYNFKTFPVSIGVKYYLPIRTKIYFTLKGDYYYTNIATRTESVFTTSLESSKESNVDSGQGYGYEIGMGFKPLINNYFEITTEFLYKYADGTVLTKEIGSPKIDFTGIYLNMRLGRIL